MDPRLQCLSTVWEQLRNTSKEAKLSTRTKHHNQLLTRTHGHKHSHTRTHAHSHTRARIVHGCPISLFFVHHAQRLRCCRERPPNRDYPHLRSNSRQTSGFNVERSTIDLGHEDGEKAFGICGQRRSGSLRPGPRHSAQWWAHVLDAIRRQLEAVVSATPDLSVRQSIRHEDNGKTIGCFLDPGVLDIQKTSISGPQRGSGQPPSKGVGLPGRVVSYLQSSPLKS